jgi:hypothetical protein
MFPHIKRVIFPFIFYLFLPERVLQVISPTYSWLICHDEQYIIFALYNLLDIDRSKKASPIEKTVPVE